MSFVDIPVMGSAQDLRRQLRYPTSSRKRNYNNHTNQIPGNSGSVAVPPTAPRSKTASSQATPARTQPTREARTGINLAHTSASASSSFPNSSNKAIHPSRPIMSSSSRARVQATNSYSNYNRASRPYVPPPPARRNYQTSEADRLSQYSKSDSARHHNRDTVPRPSSIARSTYSANRTNQHHHTSTAAATPRSRSRSRAPSPFRSLTLPDEPETTQHFPNSDPNAINDTVVPVPSGYVSFSRSKTSGAAAPRAGPKTTAIRSGSVSGHPRSTSPVAPSTVSRNTVRQRDRHYERPQSSSRAPSRAPFIPPNPNVNPVPLSSRPLARSPSRSRVLSQETHPQHIETSPSTATGDSNAGPRVREGRAIPGLTTRAGSPEPQLPPPSRSISQARISRNVSRESGLQPHSSSRAPGASHPPLSISGSATIPMPAPIPIPTPITYSHALATSPREAPSRKGIPFPSVGKARMRQLRNYIPRPGAFRQNRTGLRVVELPQGPQSGQGSPNRPHIMADGSIVQNHLNDSSSPAAIARSPSHTRLDRNQRSRSASRQSRHSKRSQRSRSRQSQRSHHSYANRSIHVSRAPVRLEGDQSATNRKRNRALKWKWPTNRLGMGKMFNSSSDSRPQKNGVATLTNVGTAEVLPGNHKRVRTLSNLSANWNLPQIKNFTILRARVHDFPTHSSLPPRPVLHPLLRTATLFRPARLHWDVRNQALPAMSTADTLAMQKLLKEPATSPPTERMRLLLRSPAPRGQRRENSSANPKYWEVNVISSSTSSQNHPYIKCMDVVRAFGKMLRTSADKSEFDSLDLMHQRLTIRVFEMRAAGIFGHQINDPVEFQRVKEREARKGYRKVDLLINQTRWDGLQSTGTNTNEWLVKLGRVPFNPF